MPILIANAGNVMRKKAVTKNEMLHKCMQFFFFIVIFSCLKLLRLRQFLLESIVRLNL